MTDAPPVPVSNETSPVGRLADRVLGLITGTILFAMMLLTFADVVGRDALNRPVYGAYEVTEFLMGSLIFTALPLLCAREGHVTIDILDGVTPKGVMRWQRFVVNLISAAALALIAWRLYALSGDLARDNEVTMTLKIPHSPFAVGFAVLSALACLATLANCWAYFAGRRDPTKTQS